MRWTTTKPTTPGWYWWRQLPTDTEYEIVRVRTDSMSETLGLIALNDEFYDLVADMPGSWSSSPIPRPEGE